MFNSIKKQIDQNLVKFLNQTRRDYNLDRLCPDLYRDIEEYALRDGKRIRPALFILSYLGYQPASKVSSSIYRASVGIELLHNFMLIHDDIIDKSDLRRGKPTLHRLLAKTLPTKDPKKLGNDLGIVAGDIVYAFAIEAFLSMEAPEKQKHQALKYFMQTTAFTAIGEYIDTINGLKDLSQVTEKDVFLNYTLKTARYTFASPLVMGAILASAPKEELDKLFEFGIIVGQAFQIQDDIIGIFGSEKLIGKSILSDLAESKKTILVCHAHKNLTPQKRRKFETLFNKPKKTYADLLKVRKIFLETGSLEYSLKEVQTRVQKASQRITKLSMNKKYLHLIQTATFEFFKQTRQIAQKNHITLS
ncbi:MAG: polyprenyl synthetase family protein [Candidatus Omnitrophica bacterium]|nr:polyprenyl synthetase family protein [Candidatus Omnitrophota bacterium]